MDQNYLRELINEVQGNDGGIVLNVEGRSEAVVLSIDKYNELLLQLASSTKTEPSASESLIKMNVLVTGGAGYIGAHVVRELVKYGYNVFVVDNLSSGKRSNIAPEATFIEGDISDINLLRDIFANNRINLVMHLAASVEVGESVEHPGEYLQNNALNTASLLRAMSEAGVKKIIFSSTAAVYGEPEAVPILESAALRPNNPYGQSKLLAERIISYYCKNEGFQAVVFRYFNACGSDFDGKISSAHESHLIPSVMEVLRGLRPHLVVNGNDYNTFDGTCVRDYIHVLDISSAHVLAITKMPQLLENFNVYNIGTSRGLSVEQIITAAAEITGRMVPLEIGQRREGDAAITIADNSKIRQDFGFEPKYSDVETIIKTSWNVLQEV